MLALFIIATWTLSFVMAITKIENLGIDKTWKGVLFFIFAPVINLVVFLGWGAVGYMKDDWEDLM